MKVFDIEDVDFKNNGIKVTEKVEMKWLYISVPK